MSVTLKCHSIVSHGSSHCTVVGNSSLVLVLYKCSFVKVGCKLINWNKTRLINNKKSFVVYTFPGKQHEVGEWFNLRFTQANFRSQNKKVKSFDLLSCHILSVNQPESSHQSITSSIRHNLNGLLIENQLSDENPHKKKLGSKKLCLWDKKIWERNWCPMP